MGLFSDKCEKCGFKVKKAAKFCSQCGALPPGGWWKCPECGKWVGQDSEFCPHCKTKLYAGQRDGIASGRWNPKPNVLSEQFNLKNIQPLLKKEYVVEAGTFAVALEKGHFLRTLEPGRYALRTLHDVEELLLVSSRETGVTLRVDDLRTAEEMKVSFYAELSVEADESLAELFAQNMGACSLEDLKKRIEKEMAFVLSNYCMEQSIDVLFKDPARRLHLEKALHEKMSAFLAELGLRMVRLTSMDFSGVAYENLRSKNGEIEEARRQAELDLEMADLAQSGKLNDFKNTHDLEQYVAQLAQERNLTGLERTQELDLLKQAQRHEIEALDAEQKIRLAVGIREEKLKDTKLDITIQHLKTDAEIEDTGKWLKVREEKDRAKNRQMKEQADLAKEMDIQQLLVATDDAEKRKDLLKLAELKSKKS